MIAITIIIAFASGYYVGGKLVERYFLNLIAGVFGKDGPRKIREYAQWCWKNKVDPTRK